MLAVRTSHALRDQFSISLSVDLDGPATPWVSTVNDFCSFSHCEFPFVSHDFGVSVESGGGNLQNSVFAGQVMVRESLSRDLRQSKFEPIKVIHLLAVIVPKGLLI